MKSVMKKVILLLPVLLLNFCLVLAQDAYERKVFVSSSGDSLNYRLLEPETMQTGEKYPLVLFLHGAGERGNDNEKQLTHGAQMFLNPVNREKYPDVGDITARERFVLIFLGAPLIILGVMPAIMAPMLQVGVAPVLAMLGGGT